MPNSFITKTDKSINFAISQLFSPSLQQRISTPDGEKKIKKFLEDCRLHYRENNWSLNKGLETAYSYLKHNYRCEYIYKNEIANQLLLAYHGDNSATLLKEVSSDASIADIVIINGETVAYEIKTELDSLERLENQLISYSRIYDKTYIVTHNGAIKALKSILPHYVGILVLDENGILKTIRTAENCYQLFDPQKAIWTLRQSELVQAYKLYEGELPHMGTALIHSYCLNWFVHLDKKKAHRIFNISLKSRKPSHVQFELIKNCNPALRILFLGQSISNKNCNYFLKKICIFD